MEKKEETKKEVENKEKTNKTATKKSEKAKEETKKEVKEIKKAEEPKKETKEVKKAEEPKKETKEVKKAEGAKKEAPDVKKAEAPKKETTVKVDTKKTTPKKDSNKKSNNNKVMSAIVAIIAIVIIACVGYFMAVNSMKTSALKEIETVFNAMRSGDKDAIKQYLDGEDSSEEEITDASSEAMAKIMLSQLNYEVISTDVNLKECNVKLQVSNKDLKTVFSNYMQKAFTIAFSQAFGKTTEEDMNMQMEKYFEEQYNSESIETVSTEITIKMTKKDGKWNMDANEDEIINAILPGYQGILEAINGMGE